MLQTRLWGLIVILLACGCSNKPQEKVILIGADPLANARNVVQRYAEGQPVASEATSFPKVVEDLRKVDPERADILEKGLNQIQANPAARVSIAKELLPKLQPRTQ
jgi:hypothetical protein